MKKTIKHYLDDLQEYYGRIQEITSKYSQEEFSQDLEAQDALLRRISVVGIIVKRLPKDFTDKYPEIPWSSAAKTRDKLAHDYEGTDMALVWQIANVDIPSFMEQVSQINLSKDDFEYESD